MTVRCVMNSDSYGLIREYLNTVAESDRTEEEKAFLAAEGKPELHERLHALILGGYGRGMVDNMSGNQYFSSMQDAQDFVSAFHSYQDNQIETKKEELAAKACQAFHRMVASHSEEAASPGFTTPFRFSGTDMRDGSPERGPTTPFAHSVTRKLVFSGEKTRSPRAAEDSPPPVPPFGLPTASSLRESNDDSGRASPISPLIQSRDIPGIFVSPPSTKGSEPSSSTFVSLASSPRNEADSKMTVQRTGLSAQMPQNRYLKHALVAAVGVCVAGILQQMHSRY